MQGGFRRCCSPTSPPAPPPRAGGGCTDSTSVTKRPVKLACIIRTAHGWSGPPATIPALLPWRRGRRRGWREGERAGVRGSLTNPQSAWGLRTLGAKLGPERNFLPCRPRGEGFFQPGGSLIRHFHLGVGAVSEERREQRTWWQVNTRQRSQGGPSQTSPGQGVERTRGLRPQLSLSVKLPAMSSPSPFKALSLAQATSMV